MKNTIAAALAAIVLSGCVAYATPYDVAVVGPPIVVGFYDPGFGYWTGYGWDREYYGYGHPGYGHPYYHGPRYEPRGYHGHEEHHHH